MLRRVALVRTDVPPKLRFLQELNGVRSKETSFFRAAVKTSNIIGEWMQLRGAERFWEYSVKWLFVFLQTEGLFVPCEECEKGHPRKYKSSCF
jgi:hypothetical protein